ncbi:hypothetical protein [Candidatus Amarolinea dominans]|uniref:hypothetical protein n=1 Tax=Candidatus Amarolinea dominans TaxID=3140696 RepID=UPI001D946C91|nr:hypothetical protein [Anaerolineae bacterium]
MLEQRLAQPSAAGRSLAQVAAVLGRQFTLDALRRVSGLDEAGLLTTLDELWRRGIVRQQGADGYDFSHDKLRGLHAVERPNAGCCTAAPARRCKRQRLRRSTVRRRRRIITRRPARPRWPRPGGCRLAMRRAASQPCSKQMPAIAAPRLSCPRRATRPARVRPCSGSARPITPPSISARPARPTRPALACWRSSRPGRRSPRRTPPCTWRG